MKRVVAIDDSSIVLMSVEKALQSKYEVKAFSKVMRAFKYLKTTVPDVILLDIDMPEMNGIEVLSHIKEREELKNVPVIFLTSNNDKAHIYDAIKGGAADYMIKPVKEDVLMEKVMKALGDTKEDGFSWDKI